MELTFDDSELIRRDEVVASILDYVESGKRIALPAFDRTSTASRADFALQSVGMEPNAFNGTVGPYRYQFEGEDDLLHLFVMRIDGGSMSVEEGRRVASFLLRELPSALIWLRPGDKSQHFYVAHDDLLEYLRP